MSIFNQPELFPQLPDPTEVTVRELLEPHYPRLWQVAMAPWQDLQCRRQTDAAFRRRTKGSLAWWLQPEMVHTAQELFTDGPIRPEVWSNGQFVYRLCGRVDRRLG